MANNKQYIDILNAVVSQEESRLITIAIFGIVLVLVTLLLPSKILTLKFGKSSRSKKYSNQIIEVKILDKHNCELTIEIDYHNHQYVILPITELI